MDRTSQPPDNTRYVLEYPELLRCPECGPDLEEAPGTNPVDGVHGGWDGHCFLVTI